jgi:hypothetical protein
MSREVSAIGRPGGSAGSGGTIASFASLRSSVGRFASARPLALRGFVPVLPPVVAMPINSRSNEKFLNYAFATPQIKLKDAIHKQLHKL